MKNRTLFLIGILLALLCTAFILVQGQSYTVRIDTRGVSEDASDFRVVLEGDAGAAALTDQWMEGSTLCLKFSSVYAGKVYADVYGPEDFQHLFLLFSHAGGILTYEDFLGECTGSRVIPLAVAAYLLLLLYTVSVRLRKSWQADLYQYRNIYYIGLLIFLAFLLIDQVLMAAVYQSLHATLRSMVSAAQGFSAITLPIAFVLSVFVTATNLQLMGREGRNWRNLLGCFLGLLLCFGSVFPEILYRILYANPVIDIHNEQGFATHAEMLTESLASTLTAYLECILIGTIVLAVAAAKRTPPFDKDYMIVLGCRMRDDGTPTPLLQGRIDKALEFARTQKEATGKDLVFVPSGGQGADEPLSEAVCMKHYLLAQGIPEERILPEDRSASTLENFRYSLDLIRQNSEVTDPRIAFSTTNYHVLRAGMIASSLGVHAEGIGSRTKRYFWINAFVREFIAGLAAEKKHHLLIGALLIATNVVMVGLIYLSNLQ